MSCERNAMIIDTVGHGKFNQGHFRALATFLPATGEARPGTDIPKGQQKLTIGTAEGVGSYRSDNARHCTNCREKCPVFC